MKTAVWNVLIALAAGAIHTEVFAADASACKAPAWAAQPPPGYHIRECDARAFDELDLDLPSGAQKVYGRSTYVTYALDDSAADRSAAEMRKFYLDQATKAGATLMSGADENYNVTLLKKLPSGDEWMLYEHGSGNSESTVSFTLTTFDVGTMQQEVVAKPMTTPLDVAPKTCVDPPWLQRQFAYFAISGCEGKVWDVVDVPGTDKKIEGRRLTVNYALSDDSKTPTALAAGKNYINALQAIGATQVSATDDHNNVVFTQQTAQGEVWYIYGRGSGNEQSVLTYSLDTVLVAPFRQEVVAQPLTAPMGAQGAACSNPPWLKKQFDYFTLGECSYRDIDQITLDLPDGSKKTLAGRYLEAVYTLTDSARNPTALFVQKNYVNALQAIGAKLVSKPDDVYQAVLTQQTAVGDMWYVYKHGSGNENSTATYDLITVEVGGPAPKACTLEVYGVNFDFNKATLRPDSEPALQQVLALFSGDAAFSAEVAGHTDNVGKADYNLKLSQQRADAVKGWLLAHGVDAARISTNGYGDTHPLVPNTTDENRFKNRRVELKRNDCKP